MPAALAARTVRSADGTTISYHTIGKGPDVLVVPGALTDAADYAVRRSRSQVVVLVGDSPG